MTNELERDKALWHSIGYDGVESFLYELERKHLQSALVYVNTELERMFYVANRKKGGNRASYSSGGDGWQGFANVPLTEADKNQLRAGIFSFTDGLEALREMLATGHKVTVSHNIQQGNITASATGVRDDCPNKGYTLTSFANDVTDALTVLAYKHDVVAKGDWTSFRQAQRNNEDFG